MPEAGEHLRLAAFGFGVDRVTAEVSSALEAADVPSILVKGPAIATWLYRGDESRLYGDTDLLIRARDWKRAIATLEGLGFEDDLGPLAHPRMESRAGYPWSRAADEASVDLHCTLFGIGADPEAVWAAFSESTHGQTIGGVEVRMPSYPARLLHISLHAVQHGGETLPKAMIDLERALTQVPEATWKQALELAERLQAAETFAAGLQLTPEGRRLSTRIGADRDGSTAVSLRLEWAPLSEGFEELARTPGLGAKLALLVRELVPNPAFMRWWTPLARRGRLGLVASYPWRWLWLAYRVVPGYRAWRRAARRDSERIRGFDR